MKETRYFWDTFVLILVRRPGVPHSINGMRLLAQTGVSSASENDEKRTGREALWGYSDSVLPGFRNSLSNFSPSRMDDCA